MKLWRCAAIAVMLCGAALFVPLSRILLPPKAPASLHLGSPPSPASPMSSNSSSPGTGMKLRRVRSVGGPSSVISQFMHIFQSFTDGELKQVIGALVERKARRDTKPGKRTKRAKNGGKSCSLRDVEVTVSQLGLGYVSDEIILFRYCSGKCTASRRNYDMTLAFMKRKRLLTQESTVRARHSPCCRPTEYEPDVSFLDNLNRYHTVHEVSALRCGCV
ncbi:uncharacterized protein nrtn [Brachyhypopomus gauderio]|uniref:uncharacterized protein nrtn n=1 Tax=Brachyhypopomus gauderio TaxID=698409 RepID=UPI004041437F